MTTRPCFACLSILALFFAFGCSSSGTEEEFSDFSSLSADVWNPRTTMYGASKAGLTYFLETAAIELRPRGIDVTVVHPGFVRTRALNGFPERLLFVVELDRATRIIDKGIQRRATIIRFPWMLGMLARLPKLMPRRLAHLLIRKITIGRHKER